MKHKFKIGKGIQRNLFQLFVLIVLLPSITIGASTYFISLKLIRNKVSDTFTQAVAFTKNEIESSFEQIRQVSDYLFANAAVKAAVDREGKTIYEQTKDIEKAYEVFDNFTIAGIFRSINSIRLYDKVSYIFSYSLDTIYSGFDDKAIIMSPYFSEAQSNNGDIVWVMDDSSFTFSGSDKGSVALFRVLKDSSYKNTLGVLFISLKSEYLTEAVSNNVENQIGSIYLVKNDYAIPLQQGTYVPDSLDFQELEQKGAIVLKSDIAKTGWQIIGFITEDELLRNTQVIFYVTIITIMLSLLITYLLWHFQCKKILQPIRNLTASCQAVIQERDLSVRVDVQGEDEVTILEQGFNSMLSEIDYLLKEKLEKQNEIRDMEYKALQAQITPHFIYNTLNSVRWMAILRREDDIRFAIECLGRLLKNATIKTGSIVTIAHEITNLEDYIYLLRLAYPDKFEVSFDVQREALNCHCLKFFLQPIVENAIFHGVVPKAGKGHIRISVQLDRNDIFFSVWDDGVGIPQNQIANVLADGVVETHDGIGKIGISNIHQRIQHYYGPGYGLEISSEIGEYTMVSGRIPNKTGKEKLDASCHDCGG